MGRARRGVEQRHVAHVVGERDDRRVDAGLAQPLRERNRRDLADAGRRDDQVVADAIRRQRQGGLDRGHVRDARRVPHVEIEKLFEDDLVQLAILGEDERVVQTRNQQDVVDAEPREL